MKMKIPKFFHPILGVIAGTALFLAGIAVTSCAFVVAYKAIVYAKPLIAETISTVIRNFSWLPL